MLDKYDWGVEQNTKRHVDIIDYHEGIFLLAVGENHIIINILYPRWLLDPKWPPDKYTGIN
jgi:hypothetical protein